MLRKREVFSEGDETDKKRSVKEKRITKEGKKE